MASKSRSRSPAKEAAPAAPAPAPAATNGAAPAAEDDSKKVFFGNLAFTTTEQDLESFAKEVGSM